MLPGSSSPARPALPKKPTDPSTAPPLPRHATHTPSPRRRGQSIEWQTQMAFSGSKVGAALPNRPLLLRRPRRPPLQPAQHRWSWYYWSTLPMSKRSAINWVLPCWARVRPGGAVGDWWIRIFPWSVVRSWGWVCCARGAAVGVILFGSIVLPGFSWSLLLCDSYG